MPIEPDTEMLMLPWVFAWVSTKSFSRLSVRPRDPSVSKDLIVSKSLTAFAPPLDAMSAGAPAMVVW